jgi:hypothetical protein
MPRPHLPPPKTDLIPSERRRARFEQNLSRAFRFLPHQLNLEAARKDSPKKPQPSLRERQDMLTKFEHSFSRGHDLSLEVAI